jgi:hypothetical protein
MWRAVIACVIGSGVFALGPVALVADARLQRRVDAAPTWPTATGRLQASYTARGGKGRLCYPIVRFEYEVGGTRYVSEKYHLYPRVHVPRVECNRLVEQHPVGAAVTVYYDPHDPEIGVLNPTYRVAGWSNYRILAVAALCVGLMLLLWAAHLYLEQRRERNARA